MITLLKKFKYLIIIIVVVVVGFVIYTVFTSPNSTSSSELSKTTGSVSGGSAQPNDLAKTFVDQLLAIQSINLKIEFFNDPVFVKLVDNHVDIEPQVIGRPNPFAPIGKDVGASSLKYQDISGDVIKSTDGLPAEIFDSKKTVGTSTINQSATTTIKNTKTKSQ